MSTSEPAASPEPSLSTEQQELLALLLAEEEGREAAPVHEPESTYAVVPLRSDGVRPPLFCVGVFHFRTLTRHLGADQPVFGLLGQLLDEEGRYLSRVEELATLYIRDIRRVRPHGPYHLLGFCFGGLVAYEIARQLAREGERVGFVGLIDAAVPGGGADEVPGVGTAEDVGEGRLRRHLRVLRAEGTRHLLAWAARRKKYEETRVRVIAQRALYRLFRTVGLRPPLWLNGFATATADAARGARYAPGRYDGVVTVIGNAEGAESAEALARGWAPLVREARALGIGQGTHGDAVLGAAAPQLARHLRAALDASTPES